jgi:hypothetical protein
MYKVLVGKHKEKRPLERPRHRWEDRIRMELGEIGCVCVCVEGIHLTQDRDWQALMNTVWNLQVLAPWSWF